MTERFTVQHESMVSSATGTITATFADGPKTSQYRTSFIAALQASGWTVTPEGQAAPALNVAKRRPAKASR
jgi:hypothetical protein